MRSQRPTFDGRFGKGGVRWTNFGGAPRSARELPQQLAATSLHAIVVVSACPWPVPSCASACMPDAARCTCRRAQSVDANLDPEMTSMTQQKSVEFFNQA